MLNGIKIKNDFTEICPYTFEDALIFTNLEFISTGRAPENGSHYNNSEFVKEMWISQ